MAFPANPFQGQFHREDDVLYMGVDGVWNRCGVGGLDFMGNSLYVTNHTGPLSIEAMRWPHRKVLMKAAWEPSAYAHVRIQLWNDATPIQPVGFQVAGRADVDRASLHACWGDGGISISDNMLTTWPPNNNGIVATYGSDSHRGAPGRVQSIDVEVMGIGSYAQLSWTIYITNSFSSVVQTKGEATIKVDAAHIGAIGLTWDGNPVITRASAHAQWW